MTKMKNKLLPVEILIEIFEFLNKSQIKSCLGVSKSWNKAARSLLGEDLIVQWSLYKPKMAYDFCHFPDSAAKVREITVSHACCFITGLRKCYNLRILNLKHSDPRYLLHQLDTSLIVLPYLQQINVVPKYYKYEKSKELWSFLWRHRNTVTKLIVYRESPLFPLFARSLIEYVSSFPGLKDLELSGFGDLDLAELLRVGNNLEKLQLTRINVICNGAKNSNIIQQPNLRKVILHDSNIHDNANDFLIMTCKNLEPLKYI